VASGEMWAFARGLTNGRPLRAYLGLAIGVTCIGFTAIFTKWAGVPGPAAAALRMSFATLLMAAPFVWRLRSRGTLPTRGIGTAALGGLWVGINLGFLNSALLLTSAASATLLDNMAPIWVGLAAWLLFRQRLSARYWLGLVLALAGAAVITGFRPGAVRSLNPGDALAFSGSLFYAGYLLITQRARRHLDALSCLWIGVATAAVSLSGACLLLRLPLLGYSARSYWALFGAALVSQTAGWLLINYALGYLPATTAVIILLAQPVVTSLLSIPLLGEALQPRQLIGGALVLGGIYLCVSRGKNFYRAVARVARRAGGGNWQAEE
jgi:drug/metabolite transporter (DMT)-like permease